MELLKENHEYSCARRSILGWISIDFAYDKAIVVLSYNLLHIFNTRFETPVVDINQS